MPEAPSTLEVRRFEPPPTFIGAVFETGRARMLTYDVIRKKDLVPVLDVTKEKDREIWFLENMRVFSDGTCASPELGWKGIIDFHLAELKVAAVNSDLDPKERIKTEKDIKAMMAISTSARAMEASSGDVGRYAAYITQSREPDLDKQDSWKEFLIHGDEGKIKTVLDNKMVEYFYNKIIKDAGIVVLEPKDKDPKDTKYFHWDKEKKDWKGKMWKITNEKKVFESKLMEYLIRDNPYKEAKEAKKKKNWADSHISWKKHTSLEDYVNEVLLDKENIEGWQQDGYGKTSIWAAAKLATDIFLIDKYTKWNFELFTKLFNIDPDIKLSTMPHPGWGGDPLGSIIDPSFLPREIKKVYTGEDALILTMVDDAFRPDFKNKEIKKEIEKKLPCSMTISLKNLARYSTALFTFFGNSRGIAIPQWTNETMGKDLPSIAELLDQVYGGIKEEEKLGKHIMGIVMTRILECKALATAIESSRPDFREAMLVLFGEIKTRRPFLEIEQFLWGPSLDAKSGFLASLAGGRTRFIFKDNKFGAGKELRETWEILSSNDQDAEGRGKAKVLNALGFILDSIQAISEMKKRK